MDLDIDEIKRQGAMNALSNAIGDLQHQISHRAWDATRKGWSFCGLEDAIARVESQLVTMRQLLEAIKALDPNAS